jgi:phospholipid-binding lipoprotein MlaA
MKLDLDAWWRGAIVALTFVAVTALARAQEAVPVTVAENGAPEAAPAPAAEEEEFEDEYATKKASVSDPFERVNRTIFNFNTTVSNHVLRPISRGYDAVMPAPARRGIRSFFDNLEFPVRFAGCVLQGKLPRAAAETGKFALNSTVGLAGFIKVSDRYAPLRVPDEDIGQALGAWGLGQGPFLVLPILGPSSLRDGIGRVGNYYASPMSWKFMDQYDSWVPITLRVGDILSDLRPILTAQDALQRAAVDPYLAFRNGYLQYREGEVKK